MQPISGGLQKSVWPQSRVEEAGPLTCLGGWDALAAWIVTTKTQRHKGALSAFSAGTRRHEDETPWATKPCAARE